MDDSLFRQQIFAAQWELTCTRPEYTDIMPRYIPSLKPKKWRPIHRLRAFLFDRWKLTDVSARTASWATRSGGFAVLNNYADEPGYRLFVYPNGNDNLSTGVNGIRDLSTALAAVYAVVDEGEKPTVRDGELRVNVQKPVLGEMDGMEVGTVGYPLQDIETTEHLSEVFPQREPEISEITETMDGRKYNDDGDDGNDGGGDGSDGSGPRSRDGDAPKTIAN